jgi:hypothetical protein
MLTDSAISRWCDQLFRQERLSHIDMLQGLIEMLTKMDLTKGASPREKIIESHQQQRPNEATK